MTTANAKRSYTVFEAVNEARREIYVAATPKAMFEAIADLRRAMPASIKAWNVDDVTSVRSVEFELSLDAARAFILQYCSTSLPPGWKFVCAP